MSQPDRILVVEDDPSIRALMRDCLSSASHTADIAEDGISADKMLNERRYRVVVSDLRLPGLDGLGLLSRHARRRETPRFVFVTGAGTVDDAVRAMKLGAFDFLTKPFHPGDLVDRVEMALQLPRVETSDLSELIGESPAFKSALAQLDVVAPLRTTVLLTGETGTGKEMAARFLHSQSDRAEKPFVPLHCGAVPDNLLEDELFGHVRGAFTGASQDRAGCFEMANGGTLLLDEIGTMSRTLQSKLLRVVQDGEVRRLGSTASRKVDVRLIVSTNADLERQVESGDFRADLFYRLSTFPVRLPSLRERGEDSLLLARHFAARIGRRVDGRPRRISPELAAQLSSHSWPGNVRELQNVIERVVILARDQEALPAHHSNTGFGPTSSVRSESIASIVLPEEGVSLPELVSQLERHLIALSLERTGGNKKRAAALLGLKRTTLIEKLKRQRPAAAARPRSPLA